MATYVDGAIARIQLMTDRPGEEPAVCEDGLVESVRKAANRLIVRAGGTSALKRMTVTGSCSRCWSLLGNTRQPRRSLAFPIAEHDQSHSGCEAGNITTSLRVFRICGSVPLGRVTTDLRCANRGFDLLG